MREGLLINLGTVRYGYAADLQLKLAELRLQDELPDTVLLLEHAPVVTIGNQGSKTNLNFSEEELWSRGIEVHQSDRGGDLTYHAPGQLVIYPIIDLQQHGKDLHLYVRNLEEVGIRTAAEFGIVAQRRQGHPGIWVGSLKLASVGMSSKGWVTRHGMALNVNNRLKDFSVINPCGLDSQVMTSLSALKQEAVLMSDVAALMAKHFAEVFSLDLQPSGLPAPGLVQPPWLHSEVPVGDIVDNTQSVFEDLNLNTVCREANCPNCVDCFSRGVATFLIMGADCTRNCRFCGVRNGTPLPLDPAEPQQVALAAQRLKLKHVVITSVTRDDLPDGGAEHFVATIEALRSGLPEATIEVLIPDFKGNLHNLETILAARPDILAHNLETVPRLCSEIRSDANSRRSLDLLQRAANNQSGIMVKSGIMVGLGETVEEVGKLMTDLVAVGCQSFTLGQYLSPESKAFPVTEYLTPPMFENYQVMAETAGFKTVMCGPLVRSSYYFE